MPIEYRLLCKTIAYETRDAHGFLFYAFVINCPLDSRVNGY